MDANETKKRRISEHEESMKCHNAKIGRQFSISRSWHSPSSEKTSSSRPERVALCSLDLQTDNTPTLLRRPFIWGKELLEENERSQGTVSSATTENIHLLTVNNMVRPKPKPRAYTS